MFVTPKAGIAIILLLAAGSLYGVSCRKSFTCSCTYTDTGVPQSISIPLHQTKADAQTICEGYTRQYAIYPDAECRLQ